MARAAVLARTLSLQPGTMANTLGLLGLRAYVVIPPAAIGGSRKALHPDVVTHQVVWGFVASIDAEDYVPGNVLRPQLGFGFRV